MNQACALWAVRVDLFAAGLCLATSGSAAPPGGCPFGSDPLLSQNGSTFQVGVAPRNQNGLVTGTNVTYAWSATSAPNGGTGSFSNPSIDVTTFTCQRGGGVTLTVRVGLTDDPSCDSPTNLFITCPAPVPATNTSILTLGAASLLGAGLAILRVKNRRVPQGAMQSTYRAESTSARALETST